MEDADPTYDYEPLKRFYPLRHSTNLDVTPQPNVNDISALNDTNIYGGDLNQDFYDDGDLRDAFGGRVDHVQRDEEKPELLRGLKRKQEERKKPAKK